ncbi:MAG: hypothetical protein ACE5LQ_07885, partial [Candidatus Bipolaricaulia bacterium]
LAILLEPFVPSFSTRVYRMLRLEQPAFGDILRVEPECRVEMAQPLLGKIDVEELKGKYARLKSQEEASGGRNEP